MQIGMHAPQIKRYPGTLVVARDEVNRYAMLGDPHQRLESEFNQRRRHFAAVEQVTAVDEKIHLTFESRGDGSFKVIEEFWAPASARDARLLGHIKTQMGISDQKDADDGLVILSGGFR